MLSTASQLYSRYGIKSVSMDQLANELRVSKKTLYFEFGSKDELVCECLEYEFSRIVKFAQKVRSESTCALEAILGICMGISNHLSAVCPAFFKDMDRYIDAARALDMHKESLREYSNELIQKGIEEGDIIKEIDFNVIASILIEQTPHMKSIHSTQITMTLLRGICTPQGIGKLETYYGSMREADTKDIKIE